MRHHFPARVLRLAGGYWNGADKWRVRAASLLLLALTVAQVALAVWTNYWNRALFDALEAHSVHALLLQVRLALIFALTLGRHCNSLLVKRWLDFGWHAFTDRVVAGIR